jgi:aldose 1-epimerase
VRATTTMDGLAISYHESSAIVSLEGAHVRRLSLGGMEVVKPSGDGVQTHGGIAVLIPYAGRVRHGRYTFEGKEFALPVGREGHAIHGFAKDALWEVAQEGRGSITLKARLEGEGYPGILEAEVTYSVRRASFTTECAVKNISSRDCPIVVGFHPYFLARDWRIVTRGRTRRYALTDHYFPTGVTTAYSFKDAGPKTSLDDVFSVRGTVGLRDARRSLTIVRRRMPYLVVYDGRHAAGVSVAIEPYSGLPDAFNNGIGLAVLKPGRTFACGYEAALSLQA